MRCAVYVRVSTGRQHEENQLPDCERLAAARGYDVVEVYREQGSAVRQRPECERMMDDARRGRFNVLVVWDLSRFGRSFFQNLSDVAQLDRVNVRLVSVQDPMLDTTDDMIRKVTLSLRLAWAEQERKDLVRRIHAGLDRARREGTALGRPRTRPARVAVARLREQGLSWADVASKLRCSPSAARRAVAS